MFFFAINSVFKDDYYPQNYIIQYSNLQIYRKSSKGKAGVKLSFKSTIPAFCSLTKNKSVVFQGIFRNSRFKSTRNRTHNIPFMKEIPKKKDCHLIQNKFRYFEEKTGDGVVSV